MCAGVYGFKDCEIQANFCDKHIVPITRFSDARNNKYLFLILSVKNGNCNPRLYSMNILSFYSYLPDPIVSRLFPGNVMPLCIRSLTRTF